MTACAVGDPGEPVPLSVHVHAIRAAADIVEQAGITDLSVWPGPGRISIQVPEDAGDLDARAAIVARLAALAGAEPARWAPQGRAPGWIRARGCYDGHPVHIYTTARDQAAKQGAS
jgi:hypothetical protein